MKGLMGRIGVNVLVGLLFSALTCTVVSAQSTAQISGIVSDQSGAVLPGVEVTATQTDTGLTRSVVTNETGSYTMPNLPVGPYRLEGALPLNRNRVSLGFLSHCSLMMYSNHHQRHDFPGMIQYHYVPPFFVAFEKLPN